MLIKINGGVTFGLTSSCKHRAPIVCLALKWCLLPIRPGCWKKVHDVIHDDFQVKMNTMTTPIVVWAQIEAEVYFHAENIYLLWHIYCPVRPLTSVYVAPVGTSGIGDHQAKTKSRSISTVGGSGATCTRNFFELFFSKQVTFLWSSWPKKCKKKSKKW